MTPATNQAEGWRISRDNGNGGCCHKGELYYSIEVRKFGCIEWSAHSGAPSSTERVLSMSEDARELDDKYLDDISGGQVSIATLNHEQMVAYNRLVREYRIAHGHGNMEAAAVAKKKMDDYIKSLLR